jgi:hypothetical protein
LSKNGKKAFGEEPKPDFIAEDLRGAFHEILQSNKVRQSLKVQDEE